MQREAAPSRPGPDFPSSGAGVGCFSSVLAARGSYTSKAPLRLIRPHISGKLLQAQLLEKLLLGKLGTLVCASVENASFHPGSGTQMHTSSGVTDVFPSATPSSLFFFLALPITKIKLLVIFRWKDEVRQLHHCN